MPVLAKICGLTSHEAVAAAAAGGAAYYGFVFFDKSPRSLSPAQAAPLADEVPPGRARVGLFVNASDSEIEAVLQAAPLDMLQLHGGESPERVAAVKARFGLPVMKALGIAGADDLAQIEPMSQVADQLLIDARPPKGAALPGGNGLSFDWRLIAGRRWTVPWLLAGGLTPGNVAQAVNLTATRQVDVSSGVESAPGVKDPAMIAAFLAACGTA